MIFDYKLYDPNIIFIEQNNNQIFMVINNMFLYWLYNYFIFDRIKFYCKSKMVIL